MNESKRSAGLRRIAFIYGRFHRVTISTRNEGHACSDEQRKVPGGFQFFHKPSQTRHAY